MLITIANMNNANVMSLQTGQPLAKLGAPIIDPNNLKIVAFYVTGPMIGFQPAVLFSDDIRELGELGAIVNSADNIMSPEGLVRLQEVLDYHFELNNIHVVDDNKHKLGRVENYAFDPDSFLIQQLYLKPTLMKQLSIASLTIGRDQIISIDNQKIIVESPSVRSTSGQKAGPVGSVAFDNPFRKPEVQSADRKPSS